MQEIAINISRTQKTLPEEKLLKWLSTVLKHCGVQSYVLSYTFMGDEEILKMNIEYLNHDYYTDILTFDLSNHEQPETTNKTMEGDIYISIDRVADNATKENTPFINELKRVMVHGLLHLLGYRDSTHQEKEQMRNEESKLMSIS